MDITDTKVMIYASFPWVSCGFRSKRKTKTELRRSEYKSLKINEIVFFSEINKKKKKKKKKKKGLKEVFLPGKSIAGRC